MAREPSPETQLRTARRQVSALMQEVRDLKMERDRYKTRLVSMVREIEEWKRRFDALLKIVPYAPLPQETADK